MAKVPHIQSRQLHPETLAIRTGTNRSQFGEHSEAMFLTSSFVFENAAQAAERFLVPGSGLVYARFTNPTTRIFEERLAQLEGGEDCLATASGMSAIFTLCSGLLSAGDHIVASSHLFGSTLQLFTQILPKFNIKTSFVKESDPSAWQAASQPNTKLWFAESPSNPLTGLIDIAALAKAKHQLSTEQTILLAIDNCFCTPILQKPLQLGADIVIHSATKYLDGQGRVLGGAIVSSTALIKEKFLPILRITGPTLSAFNAWVLLKGLETLPLRMYQHSKNAHQLATWLSEQPQVAKVYYPGLSSHPQHELAKRQQQTGGPIVAFEVKASPDKARETAWKVIDQCKLISITANLGDVKSTITHPATTTHGRISPEERARAGITENLIRIAVGLEHPEDLMYDLQSLTQLL
jgi:O-succinylhomoserine sulfhydrylase